MESGRLTGMGENVRVKWKLFEPTRNLELSVSQITDIADDDAKIQEVGEDTVRMHKNATKLYGWAKITEKDVKDIGLCVKYDNEPPRHAHILGWPDKREDRKEMQMSLISCSQPLRLDPPIQVA